MMIFTGEFYVAALLITGMMSVAIANNAWWRRKAPGTQAFAVMMLGVAIWAFGYAVQLASSSLSAKIFWNQVLYLGISIIPVLWMIFSLAYTGRASRLKRTTLLALFIMPFLTNLVVWTNNSHHLFWSGMHIETAGVVSTVQSTREIWFWVHTLYSYVCLMIGTVTLIRLAFSGNSRLYRGQAIALLAGVLAPWIGNALYIFDLFPVPLLDPTPFAFTLTGLTISYAIFRYGLFDLLPAARDAVIDSMSAGVIVVDANNRILEVNPAAQTFLQQANSQTTGVVGQDIFEVLRFWPDLVARFKDTTFAIVEEVPLSVGNATSYVDLRISPLRDDSGKVTGRVVVAADATARKKAADLEKAKKTAEASSQAKSAFLASMSHELRTPLNHIIGYDEMVMEEVQANQHTDLYLADLQKIHTAGKHLLNLITQILEISKLEAGMVKPQPETFSLVSFLEELVTHAQPEVEKNGNTFSCNLPEQDLTLKTDPAKLRQAVLNLLDNAGKFTHNGKISLSVVSPVDGNQLVISVQDNGAGIAPERIQTLFEAFATPENTKRSRAENLGLGLTTTRHLCQLLGGEITVESAIGQGSIFKITIPVELDSK